MSLVMGVDPGINGAMAVVDGDGFFEVEDLPVWNMPVGKRIRKRVDAVELMTRLEMWKVMGLDLVVIEAVGGRPRQSASAGFVFGYTLGLIYMGCIATRLPIETVPPQSWKTLMGVKGKSRATPDAIMQRADEMFPDQREAFRGVQGGLKVDRAEAAMLALFGQRHVLRSVNQPKTDSEFRGIYSRADTGA